MSIIMAYIVRNLCVKSANSSFAPKTSVVFFGSDHFSLIILSKIQEYVGSLVRSLNVVTTERKRRKLRSGPIVDHCVQSNLEHYIWTNDTISCDIFRNRSFDIGILASFGHMIPKTVIDSFNYGIINIHASLLPKWKGPAPLFHTILNGDHIAGVSFISIVPYRYDCGFIHRTLQTQIDPELIDVIQLRDKLGNLASTAIEDLLVNFKSIKHLENQRNENQVTSTELYAPKIRSQNLYVNWLSSSVEQVYRQYRAFYSVFTLKTMMNGKIVGLRSMINPSLTAACNARDADGDPIISVPGTPLFSPYFGALGIRCKNGWALFRNVDCKHPMSAFDFARGYLNRSRPRWVFDSVDNKLNIAM
ncbi:hypothetical protein GJ496_005316 [Pomphorhynchus laevis]|nr:hypothetical protein GJ496_005316 [Pomphorhynchus laevis]